jgi:transcriptional repressor NrdR
VCAGRFTTFERPEIVPLVVVKRSGDRQPFDTQKMLRGIASACPGIPADSPELGAVVDEIEEQARIEGPEVSSEWIGLAVLERLRVVDPVACLRFASVYKGFTDVSDFEREVRLIKRDSI